MTALEKLHEKKPREKSGSRTSSRFEFQANFSILKIIDLQEAGNDYRVFFDHFDDLTILNSSSKPTKIRFFQIKGRSGGSGWTIKQLTKEEQSGVPPRSIVGKMYQNVAEFPEATEHAVFASNLGFKFRLKNGTTTTEDNIRIEGTELHASELQSIDAVLENDFPSPRNPTCAGILLFERTNLPLQDQALFVTGRLVEHIESIAGEENVSIKALYDVLYRNVVARAGNTMEPTSLDDLHTNKSITRSDITSLINRAIKKRQFESAWPAISAELLVVGCSSIQIISIHTAAISYLRERARGDKIPNEFSTHIKSIAVNEKAKLSSCIRLVDVAEMLRSHATKITYADNQLSGALLVEAYEAMDEQK